ncbi:MAG: amidohydrolase family protein [Novosphingobium sp.]
MLIRGAELWGHGLADVSIEHGRIAAIAPGFAASGPAVEARGALLIPGLHDHHIHLAALAAKRASVWCGPPQVTTREALAEALAQPGHGWLRGIGYHESVMGLPAAAELDELVRDRPLRIQHRSGRMWLLNSAALELLLHKAPPPPGLEMEGGSHTGRLFDEDEWLRTALGAAPPSFAQVGAELARYGITGVTDMSPRNDPAMAAHFAAQMAGGALPQRVTLAGALSLAAASGPWRLGPAKLHLHESTLPEFDAAAGFVRAAHEQGRGVAVHCVSEVELVFALALFETAGTVKGDRIEHASVASDELVSRIAALGLQVCVQPHFIAERGDDYLRDVEPRHHAELYRLRAFAAAGITLAGGSDAPYGLPDPWTAMAAAVERRTPSGTVMAAGEALTPEEALALYLADPADLARRREIAVGAPADLCLLDRPWAQVRSALSAQRVRATWISGRFVHDRIDQAPG